MISENTQYSVGTVAFLAGALIGAGIALLLAPQSGAETRNMLRDYAGRTRDELMERGRDAKATFDSAIERGKEAFETVRERGKEAYETGRETLRESGKESLKSGHR
jgi:gas vesicle protein